MKYIYLFTMFLVGCSGAKISDYNQGCRDGINAFVEQAVHASVEQSVLEKGCNGLDEIHNLKKETNRSFK
jgi:hypothetical protein